ncbi:MAG: hypothetical protein IH919_04165, partial [Deltaproteobacteria bacterium]|nr:hypothetical protein [Deltaproteobacteria bacterium]
NVGHDVTCVDSDRLKLEAIGRGRSPIFEEGLEQILQRRIGDRLNVTDDLPVAVLESNLTFIAVGTPFDGERIDLCDVPGIETLERVVVSAGRPSDIGYLEVRRHSFAQDSP